MNRTILLLNVGVLVVNFFLAFQATDSQISLLRSTAEAGNVHVSRSPAAGYSRSALPYVRVLQTLDGISPTDAGAFEPRRLRAILEAIRGYQGTMEQGVTAVLYASASEDLRDTYADLGRSARREVEATLASEFADEALLRRLTTEVIKACQ